MDMVPARVLAASIRQHFPVTEVREPDDDDDGIVRINADVYLKVGFTYAIVVSRSADGVPLFGKCHTNALKVVAELTRTLLHKS